jgi:acyl carrier protein
MDEILQQIGEILDGMGLSLEGLGLDATLTGDLEMDSMELTEFAIELEAKFDIEIPDDAVTPNMTLQQAAEKVAELRGAL